MGKEGNQTLYILQPCRLKGTFIQGVNGAILAAPRFYRVET